MTAPSITPDIARFVSAFVHSYEHLESLLLLHRDSSRDWSAHEVAETLAVDRERVEPALRELAVAGIIQASPGVAVRYRGPRETFRELVGGLSYAFEHDKIEVIAAMNRNAVQRLRTDALRAFADAFVIRRRDG